MIKEKYSVTQKEYTINITNNTIDSTRNKTISKTGFRSIKDGLIGTSSAIGSYDEDKMWALAENNLNNKVPYDIGESTSNIKKSVVTGTHSMSKDEFYTEVEFVLSNLKEKYPTLIFSNKAIMNTSDIEFSNNLDTELRHSLSSASLGFVFKEKSSSNIMDGHVHVAFEDYSREEFFSYTYTALDGFLSPECKLENGTYPVIFSTHDSPIMHSLILNLNSDSFMTGASLFSNKQNEKLFNENFTFEFNTSPDETHIPFFDAEGSFNENFKYNLIENGIIKTPYTSKAAAKKFDLEHTCSAFGNYDDIPSSSPNSLSVFSIKKTHDSLESITKGEKSIFVSVSSGGSYTDDGSFAAPVQVAFLVENGKVLGKLPEFSVSSNVFDMFNNEFSGVCSDPFLKSSKETFAVLNMKVSF